MVVPEHKDHYIKPYSDLLAERARSSDTSREAAQLSPLQFALQKEPGQRSRAERQAVQEHAGGTEGTA